MQSLDAMFRAPSNKACLDVIRAFTNEKIKNCSSVRAHVLNMIEHFHEAKINNAIIDDATQSTNNIKRIGEANVAFAENSSKNKRKKQRIHRKVKPKASRRQCSRCKAIGGRSSTASTRIKRPGRPPQLQLASYGDDRSVLLSNVTSDGASSSSVSIKHSQPSDSHEDMLMALAHQKYRSGNYKQALEHSSVVYERNPRRTDNILLLGAIHYQVVSEVVSEHSTFHASDEELFNLSHTLMSAMEIWQMLGRSFLAATCADCAIFYSCHLVVLPWEFISSDCSGIREEELDWNQFWVLSESEVEDSEEQDFYVSETEKEKLDEEVEDNIIKDMPGLFGLEPSEGISSAKEQPITALSKEEWEVIQNVVQRVQRMEIGRIESEGPRESKRGLKELRRLENIVN
ncbi:hypothetical protein L484_019333 [Morus notabilis]|uniref:Uncharacterized protein n=1 Tax=Morus notabilis TaxID=981085 RepID=W9QPB5_9ROSA|nr:hypothetical protein L484_019333 [Morus notabilis]